MTTRSRPADEIRPLRMHLGFTEMTPGSVMIEMGRTRVLCTVVIEPDVPRWMRDTGKGWVTAEYGMLPGSSTERVGRDQYQRGRALEISRLIGRSLRSVVDPVAMGEMMVRVDCDVLQADGGTRTAAITGGWVALHQAFSDSMEKGMLARQPILDHVAAISVGIVDGELLLDLDYEDDARAEVDFNVVMSGRGLLVEVQGSAEKAPFSREELDRILDLAAGGIGVLVDAQKQAVAE
ncbi:MAG TPA: ribonuclease PH [Acidimicrobiia bacterium]|nr:ribonuclease PH [Acidimicrobiia bacterium]